MNAGPTRILIVDDSALYRQSIQNVLREVAGTCTVGVASNGLDALVKIEHLDPDLLTLDVRMPDMDGIELLREIKRRRLRPKAIMVSSYTSEGAQVTTDALLEGAFDFILKPSSPDSRNNRQQLRDALEQKIVAFRESPRQRSPSAKPSTVDEVADSAPTPDSVCQAVILGCSTGGPEALKIVLSKLPAGLSAPLLVVQHMPARYTASLAARLNQLCAVEVVEGRDGSETRSGQVIVAPGGQQMKLARSGSKLIVRVNDDAPENGVRPSADYLLRSVAEVLHGKALAVIMTGMGRDGAEGCRQLKQVGGYVFAQHQHDCTVYGMPKAVIERQLADRVLPLGRIAPAIVRHLRKSRAS